MASLTVVPEVPAGAQPEEEILAPWPATDKQSIAVIGPGLSLSYISAIFRLSLLGYRQQYVDLLDELLEKEPHGFSVVSKRVLAVGDGDIHLTAADDSRKAKTIAEACTATIRNIPNLSQHLSALSWASYYALSGCENHWRRDGAQWIPERLSFIHSRRLAFPVANSWDLYVWDQGLVQAFQTYGQAPTNKVGSGLRIADYPGKFIIHAPQIRGNYPTREGLGRQLAYWFALKAIATRGAPQYLERFARPWPEAKYATKDGDKPGRPASKEDIEAAKAALVAMGAGTLSSWVHPDTVTLDLKTPDGGKSAKITFKEWIEICNAEMSKAALSGTLTTEVGASGGNRALGETQQQGEVRLFKSDAKMLAETIKRDLVSWIVRLNYPRDWPHRVPNVEIHVGDKPDPMRVLEKAEKAATIGMPVDADAIGAEAGVPLIKSGDTKARRLVVYSPVDLTHVDEDMAQRREQFGPDEPVMDPVEDPTADSNTDPNTAPDADEDKD